MAKKRVENAILRGELGIDGAQLDADKSEAEVELDKAREALLRGRTWLGRECLTWLLFKSESSEPVVHFRGKPVTVVFNGKLEMRAGGGEVTEARVKGVTAPYARLAKQAMKVGVLAHAAKIQLTWGEQVFDCSIDAEFFDLRSVKLPALLQEGDDDKLSERLELIGTLSEMVDTLVEAFVTVRTSKSWAKSVVPSLKEWMAE